MSLTQPTSRRPPVDKESPSSSVGKPLPRTTTGTSPPAGEDADSADPQDHLDAGGDQ